MDSPFTRLPLYKGDSDNIVGVLHVKALLKAIRAHGGSAPDDLKIVEIANDPWFIPDTSTLLDQLQAFRERREHFAAVVDEYGSFIDRKSVVKGKSGSVRVDMGGRGNIKKT